MAAPQPAPLSLHKCSDATCRSFSGPREQYLTRTTSLTSAYDKQRRHRFAYFSDRMDILRPYSAPKPKFLKLVRNAAEGGGEDIKVNKAIWFDRRRPVRVRRRAWVKPGESPLREVVELEDDEVGALLAAAFGGLEVEALVEGS